MWVERRVFRDTLGWRMAEQDGEGRAKVEARVGVGGGREEGEEVSRTLCVSVRGPGSNTK